MSRGLAAFRLEDGNMADQPTSPVSESSVRTHKDSQMMDLVPETMDPNKHYRWVRSRGEEYHSAVTKAKMKGYTPVKQSKGGVQTVVQPDNRTDGVIAIGDCILMECPKALHLRRTNERFRHNESLLAAASAETEQMAKEKGIKVIKDSDHDNVRQVRTE